jgi:branched-chain amino acid transport system substrate-binding protein
VAVNNLHVLNTVAGKPAKTVMIIHEESAVRHRHRQPAGARAAGLRLRGQGSHQARQPDARLQQHRAAHEVGQPRHRDPGQLLQRVRAAGAHHAAAEGGAQGHLFGAGRRGVELQVREGVPDAANGIIDCNHWFNPKDKRAPNCKKRVEAKGLFFTYEIFMTYTAVRCWPMRSSGPSRPTAPPSSPRWRRAPSADHFMPYGPTKFVDGQNTGAQPLMTQVLKGDIKVIVPRDYREASRSSR